MLFCMLFCDFAESWQLGFQDPSTPVMEGIVDLFNNISFYLVLVLILVGWMVIANLLHFTNHEISHKYYNHGTIIEIIWTLTPAAILISIAIPSLKLLYFSDEVIDPALTIKAIGRQWYWSYEYSDYIDYIDMDNQSVSFDSYMIPEDSLEEGQLRLLEVDNRIVLPVNTHVRLVATAADVIHSWAVPSLGIKLDAVPGRLNQTSLLIKRIGVYFGQCSELCGTNHSKMPIVIETVPLEQYVSWVSSQLQNNK
jgi:cytochrome c oxidase subunit 2